MLEILLMMFIAMTVIGGLGIAFMYLAKNKKVQNGLFYSMAIYGIFVAFISMTSRPSNFIMEIAISVLFGLLAVIAIGVKIKLGEKNPALPKHLVAASVVLGMVYLLFG